MILVARPVATFITLYPFKYSIKEKLFISWVGLRGAASIVFAIYATTYGVNMTLGNKVDSPLLSISSNIDNVAI